MPKTDTKRAKADPKDAKGAKDAKDASRAKGGAGKRKPDKPTSGKARKGKRKADRAAKADQAVTATSGGGKAAKRAASSSSSGDLPSTLERSPAKARETWQATHDSALESYGEGERAHRTAFASLKHSFEKVGDHWEPKTEKGPSDAQAAKGGEAARGGGQTAGGVDANASKTHLLELAARLEIPGRWRMAKPALVEAIDKANRRETAKARQRS